MTERTLEQLLETHAEMLATAHDIGFVAPLELQAQFTDAKAGAGIVDALDAAIREFREGKKGVASDDGKGHTATGPKPRRPKKAAASKAKKSADKTSTDTTAEKQEVSKTAKKAKAKKTSKKAASANARKRVTFAEEAKITKIGENPAREGTGKYERIANVLKHNGKTVKTYMTTGKGRSGTLGWCVKNKVVKVA